MNLPRGEGIFYVAPDGDDAWSGRLAAPNREKTDGPFATLGRARDAVRVLKRQQGGTLARPAFVYLRGGTYQLAEPLELGPEDSGSPQAPVTYAACPGETPILSGGVAIDGWEVEEEGVYVAALPAVREGKWVFRQLFVQRQGCDYFERRYRPSQGPFVIAGLTDSPVHKTRMRHRQSQKDFIFQPGDIDPGWANLGDVEVVALHDWSASRLRIADIDAGRNVVTFTGWPVYRIGHWYKKGRNPYYVENVKEAFGQPGEWYLDRPTGLLSYRPRDGEDVNELTVVAPRTEQLIRLVGKPPQVTKRDDSDPTLITTEPRFVEHLRFQGITFAHTWWGLPEEGYSSGQGMVNLPAAVHAEFARDCRFERCTWAHLGAYALRLGEGCHGNRVVGCRMFDLGAGGVLVGVTSRQAEKPFLPTENTVENCVISDGGRVHFSPHGIWVGITQKTTLRHNVVRGFPYSTVSSGWSWNDKPTSAGNTIIEANHLHDAMMLLADGGAIYSLGWQPGSVIRGNHIHHVHRSPFAGRAPNNGIFFDQGSKGWHVADNVFHSNAQAHIRYNQCQEDWQTWGTNYYDVRPDAPLAPEAVKAIAAKAGLEAEYRDLGTPPVPGIPLLSMKLPPPPPPKPLADDFETTPVGRRPRHAVLVREEKGGRIRVTDETAASGEYSLKFADAAGLSKSFYPYLQYRPEFTRGVATARLALRVERGARVSIEWREQAHTGTGVRVAVGPEGTLRAADQMLKLPLGAWVRLEMTCGLGDQATGAWGLVVNTPEGETHRLDNLPLAKPDFARFEYLVITSGAETETAFYIDDVALRYDPPE
ncbi:MAG: right-handed parallel beta-helix repeat-containing protein [Planctomycetota bacterium]